MIEFLKAIENTALSTWVRDSGSVWSFPTILLLHTLGMSIVAGGSAIVDLALLGFWPARTSIKPLERYLPLIWAGFWMNAFTGVLMLMADASVKLTNPVFYVKMSLVAAGLILLRQIHKHGFAGAGPDETPVNSKAKYLAWASLTCWLGAITAGRLLAYVGGSDLPPGFK